MINAIILSLSLIAPSIASILNFARFYGITLLFLSPCFVLGGLSLINYTGKKIKKIKWSWSLKFKRSSKIKK